MSSHAQVAVIGGGIVGASILYWLARLGWSDCVLLERRELTSGSTWHAAGNTTYFGPYAEMTPLFAGSIATYLHAESDSGHSVGFHQTGSVRVATSPRERELFLSYSDRYARLNIPYRVIDNDELSDLHPCLSTEGLFGAAQTPTDGHVDPSGATQALAMAARAQGCEVHRHRPVQALHPENGHWTLQSDAGDIHAQQVIVAASFWTPELLRPLGIDVPIYATEHHEIITGPVTELIGRATEVPAYRDSVVSTSVRQEADGFLAGFYEEDPVFWALDGIPPDFKEDLLAPNLDRLMPHLEKLIDRLPAFGDAGIKTINNGPMCWTPDGLPMLGPIDGHPGLWLATGFNVGIGTGGGSAEFLARWMVDGKPPIDLPSVHANRFGQGLHRDAALDAIRACYRQGYRLPDRIH